MVTWHRKRIAGLCLFGAGFAAAALVGAGQRAEPVRADVSETPRREAFKAGSERNEATLKEIAETLKKIDARLERFEQAATRGGAAPRK